MHLRQLLSDMLSFVSKKFKLKLTQKLQFD